LGAADQKCIAALTWQASAQVAETEPIVASRVLAEQAELAKDFTPGVQLVEEICGRGRTCVEIKLKLDDAFAVSVGHAMEAFVNRQSQPRQRSKLWP